MRTECTVAERNAHAEFAVRRGMRIVWKPEWRDRGDDKYTFVAVEDQHPIDGSFGVSTIENTLWIRPIYTGGRAFMVESAEPLLPVGVITFLGMARQGARCQLRRTLGDRELSVTVEVVSEVHLPPPVPPLREGLQARGRASQRRRVSRPQQSPAKELPVSTTNRRAFDYARGNLWSIDPFELCIIGGKILPEDERGPLDTVDGPEHDLYDERVGEPLTEEFVNSVDAHGVDTPILIVKIDDVAVVIAGRKRVRAARVVCARRKKAGEPPIKVDCKLKRVSGSGLLAAMITENEARTDDKILTKIEKLKRLMNRGVSPEDAAIHFGQKVGTINGWLAFYDNATAETMTAARAGRLSASAAAELAKITDPDAQREKLAELVSSGERVSARAAKAASKIARGKAVGVGDKKTQKKLLHVVQATSHPNVSEKTAAFWTGAEEMLKMILGDKDVDTRLTGKLDETVSLIKTEKRAKLIKKTKS